MLTEFHQRRFHKTLTEFIVSVSTDYGSQFTDAGKNPECIIRCFQRLVFGRVVSEHPRVDFSVFPAGIDNDESFFCLGDFRTTDRHLGKSDASLAIPLQYNVRPQAARHNGDVRRRHGEGVVTAMTERLVWQLRCDICGVNAERCSLPGRC